jgi:hypothetical protein
MKALSSVPKLKVTSAKARASLALPKMPCFRLLFKHQTGAALSTAVDFGFMSLLVEFARFQPELATAIGAFCRALTNFTLGSFLDLFCSRRAQQVWNQTRFTAGKVRACFCGEFSVESLGRVIAVPLPRFAIVRGARSCGSRCKRCVELPNAPVVRVWF